MKIGICDDSPKDRAAIEAVLKQLKMKADIFEKGEQLQAAFWREKYDLILLDIEMPGIGGYELAAVLKAQNITCEIVFITDHLEMIFDSFQFKPAAFVPKQALKTELPKVMKRLMKQADTLDQVYVTKKKTQERITPLREVLHLKYIYDHEVEFTLKDGSRFSETGTMKEFETELGTKGFLRIYRDCLVNALYIARLEKDAVVLTNGEQLTIARERRESVRKTYMEYLMRN